MAKYFIVENITLFGGIFREIFMEKIGCCVVFNRYICWRCLFILFLFEYHTETFT